MKTEKKPFNVKTATRDEKKAKAVELKNKGMSVAAIARSLGMSDSWARLTLKAADAKSKKPATKRAYKRRAPSTTPDLMSVTQKGTGARARIPRGEFQPPTLSKKASQLADEFEAEAKRLQSIADILRGKA